MRQESEQAKKEREEFEAKQADLLADVPNVFRGPLSYLAWERGHAYGYQEVLGDLGEFIEHLRPAWEQYKKDILAEG